MFFSLSSHADYQYQLLEKDSHKIHILTIDPKEYNISLVAAHNQVFGRERIEEIAKRENAQIAINAGFFEIGDIQDGKPSGTLVNDSQLYGMISREHAVLVKNEGKFSVETISPSLEIKIGMEVIRPSRFNNFASGEHIFYFNRNWGPSTLSSFNDRKEIIIDSTFKIQELSAHGNNKIPDGGYVLSLPSNYDLAKFKIGEPAEFLWSPSYLHKPNNFAVMGIPALIKDGVICEKLSSNAIHARTAFGIREDGNIVIIIAEHIYEKEPKNITLGEVKKITDRKNITLQNLKVNDLKKIVLNEFSTNNKRIGLTILELANFMKEMGCVQAINLDGGGSSSLYVDGKYINESYGDKDELEGQKLFRPVSDAMVFKKL